MDAMECNWRGMLQEEQQKSGFAVPTYETCKTSAGNWDVTIFFDGDGTTNRFERQFLFSAPKTIVRKKEAEKMASKALWAQLSSAKPHSNVQSSSVPRENAVRTIESTDDTKRMKCAFCDVETSEWILELVAKMPHVHFLLYLRRGSPTQITSQVLSLEGCTNFTWLCGDTADRSLTVSTIIAEAFNHYSARSPSVTSVVSTDDIMRIVFQKMPGVMVLTHRKQVKKHFQNLNAPEQKTK